ncbi:hypothetical protein [Sphingomonas sp. NFX23]|uniref:hypothetical protein n=1 Tax=Sphingomonas sp. NFX23 TaxID=2819532 RepID=UPI003CE8A10A
MTDVDRHWRYVIALTLIVGYVGLAAISFFHQVPANNTRFVDGFFTGLGPIVGAAVAAVLNVGKGSAQQDANLATALDKLPPQTTGTGPATPTA